MKVPLLPSDRRKKCHFIALFCALQLLLLQSFLSSYSRLCLLHIFLYGKSAAARGKRATMRCLIVFVLLLFFRCEFQLSCKMQFAAIVVACAFTFVVSCRHRCGSWLAMTAIVAAIDGRQCLLLLTRVQQQLL